MNPRGVITLSLDGDVDDDDDGVEKALVMPMMITQQRNTEGNVLNSIDDLVMAAFIPTTTKNTPTVENQNISQTAPFRNQVDVYWDV